MAKAIRGMYSYCVLFVCKMALAVCRPIRDCKVEKGGATISLRRRCTLPPSHTLQRRADMCPPSLGSLGISADMCVCVGGTLLVCGAIYTLDYIIALAGFERVQCVRDSTITLNLWQEKGC